MSTFANNNNIFINGTLSSGVSAILTGNAVPVRGMGKFTFSIETTTLPNLTATIQARVNPSQNTWVNLYATGITTQTAVIYQTVGPFDAIRGVIAPYSSGTCNIWYMASQI